ncbi:MAG: tRNA pseudouridine(55) synthase TruB [Acidobacteria bacterium]|nr:tRNA pseudouridine(55) synthase TruB [Acidobacteriota bacterium]
MNDDGILIIDKPADWTSHDVVAKLRGLLKTRRIGHTGTLDPFATGVLVMCVNRATRLVQFLTAEDKEYVATMRLGFATDTGDLTGKPIGEVVDASHITAADVESVLPRFRGLIQQTPPMYSAKKIDGKKLYELARRGETVERAAITVEIQELEVVSGAVGGFTLRVVCSSGTYIRTLAEDIGKVLGVGAHLIALRRTRAGRHTLAEAHKLEALAEAVPQLIAMPAALNFPTFAVSDGERDSLWHGKILRREASVGFAQCVDATGQLIALVEYLTEKKGWQPRVVFHVQTNA